MALSASRGRLLRRALPLVVAVLLLGWAAFGRDLFPPPHQPLRVALHDWIGYAPFHLAAERGLLDPARVKLDRMSSSPVAAVALHANALDVAALTLDEALRLLQENCDVRILLVLDESAGADAVVARPPYGDLAGLRGHRVAVEFNSTSEYLLTRAFEIHGFKPSEFEVVPLTPDQQPAAWGRGDIDAAATFEPFVTKMTEASGRVVFDSREIPGEIVDVLVVRADVLEKRREDLHHLVDGWFAALDLDRGAGSSGEAVIARHSSLSLEDTRRGLAGMHFPDRTEAVAMVTGSSPPLLARATRIRDWMTERKMLVRGAVPSDLFGPDLDAFFGVGR